MSRFADVILPLPLAKYFTYRIPEEWQETLVSGSRVIVPFGRKRFYTAIVARLHNNEPQDYEIKDISTLLDSTPVFTSPSTALLGMARRLLSLLGRRCIQGRRTLGIKNRKRDTNRL